MNLKTGNETKKYIKQKVTNFMEEYQRTKLLQEEEKRKIRQNVMLEIMSNRQKSQSQASKEREDSNGIENTFKTMISDKNIDDYVNFNHKNVNHDDLIDKHQQKVILPKHIYSNPQSRREQLEQVEEPHDIQQITFNMKKRNRSLEEQITFNRSQISQSSHNIQKQEEEVHHEEERELSQFKNELAEEEEFLRRQEQEEQRRFMQEERRRKFEEEEEIRRQIKLSLSKLRQQQTPKQIYGYMKQFQEKKKNGDQLNKSKLAEKSIQNKSRQVEKQFTSQKSFVNKSNYSNKQKSQIDRSKGYDDVEQDIQKDEDDDKKGVFLTMQEEESMNTSDVPRTCAFQIKSDPIENIQQLRKAKIMELQKKRLQRMEEFRRNQSQKKIVEIPKGKNSYSRKNIKSHQEQEIIQPPRSTTIDKKSARIKSQKDIPKGSKDLIPLQTHQTRYNLKPLNDKKQNPSTNYNYANNESEKIQIKPLSPFRTPKSILSENRGKSSNKNNIFAAESPQPRQKSANRLEPKIQPKDRKNSFTKQSNKKLMINAITYVCFPGELNRKERQKLIDVIESSEHEFFIFLFKEYSRKIIKGIYTLDSNQSRLQRIYGEKAPFEITSERVQEFYRFDSGSREFKKVDGCKSFSLAIHAIDIR